MPEEKPARLFLIFWEIFGTDETGENSVILGRKINTILEKNGAIFGKIGIAENFLVPETRPQFCIEKNPWLKSSVSEIKTLRYSYRLYILYTCIQNMQENSLLCMHV